MMSLYRSRLLTAALAAVSLTAASLAKGSAAATIASPPSSSSSVVQTTLANGLRVVVLPDHLAPVVTTWLNVMAGSDDEPYTGLAHAQEHMFFRGSHTLSGAQADEIAGFTGDEDNADTQAVITQYFHTVPSQDLDLALHLDASRFSGILDDQKDWSEERGAIEEEVRRDNGDAGYRLATKIQHQLMAGTPYADEGLGTLQSFNTQINAPQLQAFYGRWYHPNNAIYVIAGDVDPATAIADVKHFMGDLPSVPLPPRPAIHLRPLKPAVFNDTSDQGSTTVIIGYRFPSYGSSDYAASVLLADALNNQRSDAYGLVASGKLLDVETDTSEFPEAGFATITAHVPVSVDPKRAVGDIESMIDAYRQKGIPESLVTASKLRETVQAATAADSIKGLAEEWSETLPVEHRTPDDDLAAIRAATTDDVNRVLRAYFYNPTASIGIAVPKNGASGGDAAGAGGGESAKPQTTKTEPLPAWAQTSLDSLQPPKRSIAPVRFTLANGLHVIVRTDRTSSAVVLQGIVRHEAGIEEPDHQAGVGDVTETLMPYGTATFSRLAYQAQLDAIAATVKTGFAFSLSGIASHLDRGVQLLADDELHPAFGAGDFAIVRDQRAAALAGDATTPDHLTAVAIANGLYPDGDPARHFASADDVKNLTLDDVKAFYAKAFRPDLTTIAVVGDVTPARARATIERWFGGWQASGPAPDLTLLPAHNNQPSATTIPATGRIQDTATLDETLALGRSDPDLAPLELANTMLSGDFSSILIRDMRVTTGYVYFVGTAVRAERARSVFAVQYACAPANFSKAQRVLERDLRDMAAKRVSHDRLQRAKSRLLSDLALAGTAYDTLAAELATNDADGLTPDEPYLQARREFAATADDVRTASARWLRPTGFVRVVEGPTPR